VIYLLHKLVFSILDCIPPVCLSEVEVVLSYFESYFEGEKRYALLLVEFVSCISSMILVGVGSGRICLGSK
jgi:hypothetical protein